MSNGGNVHYMGNIFGAPPPPQVDLAALTREFTQYHATDWSIPEAFLCLLLMAVQVDGVSTREEIEEVKALMLRSRVVKAFDQAKLVQLNQAVVKKMTERTHGVEEACKALPTEMRLPVFAHCVDIVLADGNFVPQEQDYLQRIMTLLDLKPDDARKVIEVIMIKNTC